LDIARTLSRDFEPCKKRPEEREFLSRFRVSRHVQYRGWGDFRKLELRRRGLDLAAARIRLTEAFPKIHRFELSSQIRRAAASVPANVAEGMGRLNDRNLIWFLRVAFGSACELETRFLLAEKLGMIDLREHRALMDELTEIQKMLAGGIRKQVYRI
jgi:four helix bundle protein